MPHKGTPIRYGQKRPVRSRQQGAEKIFSAAYVLICQQENEVSVKGNLQVGRN